MFHDVIDAFAARFNTDDVHILIIKEGIKQTHGVGSTTNCGDQRVGQTTLGRHHLLFGLFADDGLEIAHHRRVRMWACNGSDAIECVAHIGHPIAQRIVHGILKRSAA